MPVLPETMGYVMVPTASTATCAQNATAGTIGGHGAGRKGRSHRPREGGKKGGPSFDSPVSC